MSNTAIKTELAPGAIGPYSQAIIANNTVYVSGQLGINPKTGEFDSDDIITQTKQSLENVKAILNSVGYDMCDVVKSTVLLKDIKDFSEMNKVYAQYFVEPFPARAAFEVANLPKGGRVEIEVVAVK